MLYNMSSHSPDKYHSNPYYVNCSHSSGGMNSHTVHDSCYVQRISKFNSKKGIISNIASYTLYIFSSYKHGDILVVILGQWQF